MTKFIFSFNPPLPRAGSRGGAEGPGPGPPTRGPPTSCRWWGPPEKNDVKIADFVEDSSKDHNFYGALCAQRIL